MKMTITDIDHGEWIPTRFAFGEHDPESKVRLCANRNPGIHWGDLPADTRTLVLLCVDTSVPTRADDVNKEGREVPADLPRGDFYHWVMVDIPVDTGGIPEGSCADGISVGGKRNPTGPPGSRQGLNDYTGWFAEDPDMAGEYLGYDGPCPPWNDSIPHEYNFVLYATDLPRCPVEGAFTGAQVVDALAGHILSEVRIVGLYATNPAVIP